MYILAFFGILFYLKIFLPIANFLLTRVVPFLYQIHASILRVPIPTVYAICGDGTTNKFYKMCLLEQRREIVVGKRKSLFNCTPPPPFFLFKLSSWALKCDGMEGREGRRTTIEVEGQVATHQSGVGKKKKGKSCSPSIQSVTTKHTVATLPHTQMCVPTKKPAKNAECRSLFAHITNLHNAPFTLSDFPASSFFSMQNMRRKPMNGGISIFFSHFLCRQFRNLSMLLPQKKCANQKIIIINFRKNFFPST